MATYKVYEATQQQAADILNAPLKTGETLFILTDETRAAQAAVLPALGNQCVAYSKQINDTEVNVIEGPTDAAPLRGDPILYGNPILFPFPNRIREGQFRYNGQTYTLPINEPERGHAIHGLVYTRPWRVIATGANDKDGAFVTSCFVSTDHPEIRTYYPFDFQLEYTYRLKDGILHNEFTAINLGTETMPIGFGVHPWFPAPLSAKGTRHDCRIHAPVSDVWELDDGLVPVGTIRPAAPGRDLSANPVLGDEMYDDVYTGLSQGDKPSSSVLTDPNTGVQVVVTADEQFRELVVYAPLHRDVICIEPYTCTTDAFNLNDRGIDAGTIELAPQERWSGRITYDANSI